MIELREQILCNWFGTTDKVKDNLELNPQLTINFNKIFLVAFVSITPQYNSLTQRSKSNKVQATTYYIRSSSQERIPKNM
jgi:hypothetical protein